MTSRIRNIILRAIASPDFIFRFDPGLDEYWATRATSTKTWVRDALEHVGDGRIAPCIFSLLVLRWASEPVGLLKMVCQALCSNLVFSAILMSIGAYRGRLRTTAEVKDVADNFEAYIAAYARQFGTRRLKLWVFRAFGPLVDSIHSACITATSSPVLVYPPAITIENALASLLLVTPPAQRRIHKNNPGKIADRPNTPVKRKGSDENAPLPKKAKLQNGPKPNTAVLGDRTNRQSRSKGTHTKRRRTRHQVHNTPPALLQRMTSPSTLLPLNPFIPYVDVTPTLLQRLQSPSSPPHQYGFTMPPRAFTAEPWTSFPAGPHHAVSIFSSSSHMPWWTASGIFASAMEEIGIPPF
ncbi:hypothetical protein C8R44DRAFT_8868 [Mycena epipterygia]|nr:hypothetical protein C8R44DRAFT_8868 [Mycena epipterygia]